MATEAERFWAKVEKTDGCWLWTGAENGRGYGTFWSEGMVVRAHRWAYGHLAGPIPDGLDLDHLCRVKSCVNPDHLEPVTHRVNVRRGYVSRGAGAQHGTWSTYCHGCRCPACKRAMRDYDQARRARRKAAA